MRTVRFISWIARVAFVATMVLGLLFWITQLNLISFHILFGITGVLSLLVLGTVAVFTRGTRLLGVVSMVYAVFVPVFGLRQSMILVGDLHWLIQVAHLLVGIGAMVLAQQIDKRYRTARKQPREVVAPEASKVQAML